MKFIDADPIEQLSLSEQVAEKIKKLIIANTIKQGTRLIVDVLAESLSVSRTPVREGLKLLANLGFITYDGKSYMVTSYSKDDVKKVYEIRIALEVLAVKLAAESITDGSLSELEKICKSVKEGIGDRENEFFVHLDIKFHEIIDTNTNNDRLQKLLTGLREQTLSIRESIAYPVPTSYREEITLKEHQRILDALKEHNQKEAVKMMEEHLRNGEKRTLDYFDYIQR